MEAYNNKNRNAYKFIGRKCSGRKLVKCDLAAPH